MQELLAPSDRVAATKNNPKRSGGQHGGGRGGTGRGGGRGGVNGRTNMCVFVCARASCGKFDILLGRFFFFVCAPLSLSLLSRSSRSSRLARCIILFFRGGHVTRKEVRAVLTTPGRQARRLVLSCSEASR